MYTGQQKVDGRETQMYHRNRNKAIWKSSNEMTKHLISGSHGGDWRILISEM